jgi:DNA-binding MarR family transcriptional regulator
MTEVAQRIGRDPSTATRFVDRAAADGLVLRRPGARDRRRRVVGLTTEGAEARRALLEVRTDRAEALGTAILDETGLHEGQVAWFLGALVKALARGPQ